MWPFSSRFDLALVRRFCLACVAPSLWLSVRLRRPAPWHHLAWFGLQFRFALWFSINCWTYARDERVEPTQGLL